MPPKNKRVTRGSKKNPPKTTVDHTAAVVYVMTQDNGKKEIFTDQKVIMDYMQTGKSVPDIRSFPDLMSAVAFANDAKAEAMSAAKVTPEKKPAAKSKSPTGGVAKKPSVAAKSSSDEKKARLNERIRASGKGKPYLRISYFPSALGKDNKIPVALEFLNNKDICYWLFKPDMFINVIDVCYSDDPISDKDFFNSLMEVGVRDNPYGLNHHKQDGSFKLYTLVGLVTVSSMKPDFPTEMENIGKQLKELFNDDDFKEYYKEANIMKSQGLKEYLEKDDLWSDMDAASIRVHEKDHLDALFVDGGILQIMDRLFSKAPNSWSETEVSVAYRSGEIPSNIL